MIVTADVEKIEPKLTSNPYKRPPAPSASGKPNDFDTMHEIFNFLLDIENPSAFSNPDAYAAFLSDIEYLSTHNINESLHFAKKSDSVSRTRARKFYNANKGKVKKMAKKLKDNKAKQKKKEIMAKSGRTGEKKRTKKKYNTRNHVSDARLKKGAQAAVNSWFEPHHYRVIMTFTINESITARLNEKIDHHGLDSFELIKRDRSRIKFEVNAGKIKPFLKMGALIMEDII